MTRVVITGKGIVIIGDADDDNVRIGERLAPFDIGLQLFEQTVGLQSIVLGKVLDLNGVAGCLGDGCGVAVDEAGAATAVIWAVVWERITNRYQGPGSDCRFRRWRAVAAGGVTVSAAAGATGDITTVGAGAWLVAAAGTWVTVGAQALNARVSNNTNMVVFMVILLNR